MERDLVSILLPIRDGKVEHFDASLNSIVNQTYSNLEIMILDNGASEKIKNHISWAKKLDRRIRVINVECCKNLAEVLNQGIKKANGTILMRQDADDISYPKRVETTLYYMHKDSDLEILGTRAEVIDEEGKKIGLMGKKRSKLGTYAALAIANPFIHSSIAVKKNVLNRNKYNENYTTAQDYELWSRIVKRDNSVIIEEKQIRYRISEDSITNKKRDDQIESHIKISNNTMKKRGYASWHISGLILMRQCLLRKKGKEKTNYINRIKYISQAIAYKCIDKIMFS
ncbi:glycosyltransferase [Synechococcus sp. RS9916]|uniref:glycosyltransferase n=1 Tax=Synechococcus sp. RS9916 TaxID=221359 RepID=UPI0000E5382D|nr:glycosyltransferase [Synechococcus sp. RS9916]EAU75557.1 glycosyl transferase domain protein [Synechococcus sp. RS9916]